MGAEYEMQNKFLNMLGFLLSLAGIIFFAFFLWMAATIYKNEAMRNEKNMLDLYLSEQEKNIQIILDKERDMRKFRHDVKEHMYIIGQCIEQKDYEEAKAYVQRMSAEFEQAQMKRYTGVTTIDAILSDKEQCMIAKGIQCDWRISMLKLSKQIEEYDICTILINILNNALEACNKLSAEDKKVHLVIETLGERLCLQERNKVDHVVQFDKEKNPISTKQGANHGLGSKNIRGVVERYQGKLNYQFEEKEFSIEIIL